MSLCQTLSGEVYLIGPILHAVVSGICNCCHVYIVM